MATDTVRTRWIGDMAFEGDVDGHKIIVDALPQAGGQNRGARTKPVMMLALAGCTGMDVISISKKMRLEIQDLDIIISGDLSDDLPRRYISMHIIYEIKGRNLPMDKLRKVVEMSEQKYCGVRAVYEKAVKMTSEIKIIEI